MQHHGQLLHGSAEAPAPPPANQIQPRHHGDRLLLCLVYSERKVFVFERGAAPSEAGITRKRHKGFYATSEEAATSSTPPLMTICCPKTHFSQFGVRIVHSPAARGRTQPTVAAS